MKSALSALFVASAVVVFPLSSRAVLITNTFDDYSDNGSGTAITNGYGGLAWTNIFALNTTLYTAQNGTNGWLNATVSASNVAYTTHGEIDFNVPGTDFIPRGVYLTAPMSGSLFINQSGFLRGQEVESFGLTISSNSPFFYNWFGFTQPLDRLIFSVESGQGPIALDNFSYTFTPSPVPEPSTMLLCAMGTLALCRALATKRLRE